MASSCMLLNTMVSVIPSSRGGYTPKALKIGLVDDVNKARYRIKPWKVMVIDDDPAVHDVTRMVLSDYDFLGRPLELIEGYSAEDARVLMARHPDTAVVLLDVVMETDDAGLKVVEYIRQELANNFVRIILRTGQPGMAPESRVITEYDINDYKDKSDLTVQKLYTSITTALRSYQDMRKLEQLIISNEELEERVRDRTQEVMRINEELKLEINKRTIVNNALSQSQERLAHAQRIARIGSWEWDQETDSIIYSDQIAKILGMTSEPSVIQLEQIYKYILNEDIGRVKLAIENTIKTAEPLNIEHRIVRPDGSIRHVHQQGQISQHEGGKFKSLIATMQDITERHKSDEIVRKLYNAIEQIADAVMITDAKGFIEYINPAFLTMTEYDKNEVVGKTPSFLKSNKQSEAYYKRLWSTIRKGEVFNDIIINKKKSGVLYYEEKTITPQKNMDGIITHFISTSKDITERMLAQQKLEYMAHHDALTGLPNRMLLQDRLEQMLARSPWHKRVIAILFLDMDRFKVINDTLGHTVGDKLLKLMAQRLMECVREGDTVARLGGDEFAIILNDIANEDDVSPVADKILQIYEAPFNIDNSELFITTSIGISMFPNDGDNSQALLKKADVAMYRAKSYGKNNYQFYTKEDDAKAVTRLSLETCLRRALERNEFDINYQAQIDLESSRIFGLEALLRWSNEEFKTVSPRQFIPLLEETGLIVSVGDWILRQACIHQQERHLANQRLRQSVSVNLSIRQFQRNGFVKKIESILAETGLDPQYLELEITEGILIEHVSETAKIINELNEIGIKMAIDDFGTGYSSMNYLKRLPFQTVKVDRSFVRDVTINQDDAAITNAIITLAHNMGMRVIAEGVETIAQLNFLKENQCDAIQGYICSPPIPNSQINEFIERNNGIWTIVDDG